MRTVGGHKGNGWAIDVISRAVLVLASDRLSSALRDALADACYCVATAGRLDDVVDVVGPADGAVVVLDDNEPDWLRTVADLVRQRPSVQPVLVADLDSPEEFLAVVSAGVVGLVPPEADLDAMVRTIESVRQSGSAIPRRFVSSLIGCVRHGRGHLVESNAGPIEITDREWEILQLLLQRRSTKEMAEALFISVGTVRSHVSTLLQKLGASDRETAIAMVEHTRRS